MNEFVFTTIHGSRLYGLHHKNSDHDRFTVTTTGKTSHIKTSIEDHVEMGILHFIDLAKSGSHQSVEALFSPYKNPGPAYHQWWPILNALRITGLEVTQKYQRTITAFAHGNLKKRQHAVRLAYNLRQLQATGRAAPVMTPQQIDAIKKLSTAYTGNGLVNAIERHLHD